MKAAKCDGNGRNGTGVTEDSFHFYLIVLINSGVLILGPSMLLISTKKDMSDEVRYLRVCLGEFFALTTSSYHYPSQED